MSAFSLTLAIDILGGLGLFLFGMKLMGDGLESLSGERLKRIFDKITSNPFEGVLTGTIITGIIQSSSAVTVMIVGFVNAGIMNLTQATFVIMGANIGTTITTQLIAFNFTNIAPVFISIGAFMVIFFNKKFFKESGNIALGFGLLFLGFNLMSDALIPLRTSPMFTQLILILKEHTILSLLFGLFMTAIIQSSTAVIGILIIFSTVGILPVEVAIPLIYGTNIGTCATVLFASVGTSRSAMKAALIHLLFNVIGSLIFLFTPLSKLLLSLVIFITPGVDGGTVAKQIANAHTIFNILNTIILFPFTKQLIALVNFMLPGTFEIEVPGAKYIDERLLETPSIAFGQSTNEIIRMGTIAKNNLEIAIKALTDGDLELINNVYINENLINLLETDITSYLVKISNCDISDDQRRIIASYYHVVNDIERIGDHAENIADLANEKIFKNLHFSQAAINELTEMANICIKAVDSSLECFGNYNVEKSTAVNGLEEEIDTLEKELRESHIKRLNSGVCSATIGAMFLDIVSNLERVGDHAINIAEILSYK
ncbi:MAG: Na/Pi cotransporter family protein, partial [Clostridium sp.]|uniref:Na/Pi cotransporter family protein n=1 Tax=Clostridium sp. TaxID=1506 RepID=UPI00304B527C